MKDQSNLFAFLLPIISACLVHMYTCPCTVTTWDTFKTHIFRNLSLVLWCSWYCSCTWINPVTDKLKIIKCTLRFFFLMKGIESNELFHDKFLLKSSFYSCWLPSYKMRYDLQFLFHSHTGILKAAILGGTIFLSLKGLLYLTKLHVFFVPSYP